MTASPVPCPSLDVLETIALGGTLLPSVREHLACCDTCRAALQRIHDDNQFLRRFAVGDALPSVSAADADRALDIPGYEIVREIHRGGQGVVYLANQQSTKREVAIKVMKQGPFATLADRARFEREIETLGRLDHPNIVTVHDAGVAGGYFYFVMNYIDGQPLDQAVLALDRPRSPPGMPDSDIRPETGSASGRLRGPLQARLAAALVLFTKVCDAVHAAHLRGVIHRDIKPSNIRVDRQGEPHVLDFGLAKSVDAPPDSAMTQTGQFVGSLPWASPEQVEGVSSKIDLRTDVYSLGAVLYQLLTGVTPFDVGSNLRSVLDDILLKIPPRPSAVASAAGGLRLDNELDTIIYRCLAKDRERRYQSAGDLARDLRRYLAGEAIEAKRDSAIYLLRKTLQRYRFRVAVATAFIAVLGVLAVVMAVLYRHAARLEREAVHSAATYAHLLAHSNIEQGRMAGMLGNMAQAEQFLWRELLIHRVAETESARAVYDPPGPPEAYWGLWELYRRYPCLRTVVPQPVAGRTARLAADGRGLWTVDGAGQVQKLDARGAWQDSYRLQFPNDRGVPFIDATGETVLNYDGQRFGVWRRGAGDRPVLEIPPLAGGSGDICLARNGLRVAALVDGAAVVWSTAPVGELARLAGDEAGLTALAISSDSSRLAGRDRLGGLYVWDLETQRLVVRVRPAASERSSLHNAGEMLFSPDDRWLADAWVEVPGRIWDLQAEPPTFVELSDRPGDGRVQGFSPDGQLLAIGDWGGTLRIFDVRTGQRRTLLVAHAGRVRSVAFTGDGRGVWTCGEDTMRLWEVAADAGVRAVHTENESYHTVDISPDGRWLIAAGGRGRLYHVDCATLAVSTLAFENDATISCTVLSADGRRTAATTYGNAAYLWNAADAATAPLVLAHPNRVSHADFSLDGARLATACDDGAVRIWRTADGTLEHELRESESRIPQVAFEPSGQHVAAAKRSGALLVWSLDTGRCDTWAPANQVPLRAVRYSADGRWLISAGAQRTVDIWDTALHERVATLVGHNQEVYCVDISRAGDLIASGDTGGAIQLWNARLHEHLALLDGHTGAVMAVRFAPDGRTLASASLDGSVRLWDLTHYAQHIAGNLEPQLRRLQVDETDPGAAAAWRRWAAGESESTPSSAPAP